MHPSRGKKRKRATTQPDQDDSTMAETPPPRPAIGNHVLVGLNSVTRHLEALAAKTAPSTALAACREQEQEGAKALAHNDLRPLSMVVLSHPKPSLSPAHAHLPTLVHLCSLSRPCATPDSCKTATRLVPLPTSADSRLASRLHIPRVGALGIYADAPGAKALEDYVREHVGVTECKWIDEAMSGEWRGMNVRNEMARAK